MAPPPPPPILHLRFTLPSLFYLIILLAIPSAAASIDIATILSPYPDFSSFASLLASAPSLTNEISHRSSITLLAVPNAYFSSSVELTRHLSPSALYDLLSYHILLQYFSLSDLRRIPPAGLLVTTLYQTTGRAPSNFGSVNVTRDPGTNSSVTIHSPASYSNSNATVLSLVKSQPYNLTILSVNSLLVPYGFNLMASETRPPLGINITKALIDGHNFFVAASMLAASGVVDEFEADEGGAGITLFVPTDAAFADLPGTVSLQSLPAERKAVVLKFHVLHSYYPLGSLESIVNPVQPTLATEDIGAGRFTLNISRLNGSVAIDSGIVQASVTQTVFDQNPVAIFGVSRVLLPKEVFGRNPIPSSSKTGKSDPPEASMSPEKSPDTDTQPSHLSSPPDFREDIKSGGGGGLKRLFVSLVSPPCIVLLYLFV